MSSEKRAVRAIKLLKARDYSVTAALCMNKLNLAVVRDKSGPAAGAAYGSTWIYPCELHLYNPFFHNGTRVNLVQVWDHNPNGSITFNLLYTFEQKEKIVQKEIFGEHYQPFPFRIVKEKLSDLGYDNLYLRPVPCDIPETDFEKIDWYRIIARKGNGLCSSLRF